MLGRGKGNSKRTFHSGIGSLGYAPASLPRSSSSAPSAFRFSCERMSPGGSSSSGSEPSGDSRPPMLPTKPRPPADMKSLPLRTLHIMLAKRCPS